MTDQAIQSIPVDSLGLRKYGGPLRPPELGATQEAEIEFGLLYIMKLEREQIRLNKLLLNLNELIQQERKKLEAFVKGGARVDNTPDPAEKP